jgi:hypothetical protein
MESFYNEFFRLIRPLDREQAGKGGIIQAWGEALELGAACHWTARTARTELP